MKRWLPASCKNRVSHLSWRSGIRPPEPAAAAVDTERVESSQGPSCPAACSCCTLQVKKCHTHACPKVESAEVVSQKWPPNAPLRVDRRDVGPHRDAHRLGRADPFARGLEHGVSYM